MRYVASHAIYGFRRAKWHEYNIAKAIGYAVIISYILKAFVQSVTGELMTVDTAKWFAGFSEKDYSVIPFHIIVVVGTLLTLLLGAKSIEKSNKIMMPVFFIIFVVLAILCVVCLGVGVNMEPIFKWGPWMDIVSIYIIPIGATLGAASWFWVMKKDDLLAEINRGVKKPHGNLWHSVGRYGYVVCALILCIVALCMQVAF